MMNNNNDMYEKFSAAITLRYEVTDEDRICAFYLDLEQQDSAQLCVQRGTSIYVFNENGVNEIFNKIIVPELNSHTNYYEAEDSIVRFVEKGQSQWSFDTTQKSFGLGFKRNSFCDFVWDNEAFWFFNKPDPIIQMEVMDVNNDGFNELVLITTWAMLYILDRKGEVILKKQLPYGVVTESSIFKIDDDTSKRTRFVVSVDYFKTIHYVFHKEYSSKKSFVINVENGCIEHKNEETFLQLPLKIKKNVFLSNRNEMVEINQQTGFNVVTDNLEHASTLNQSFNSEFKLIVDPIKDERYIVTEVNTSNSKIGVGMASMEISWEAELPETQGNQYEYIVALGGEDEPQKEMMAVMLEIKKVQKDLDVWLYEKKLLVFGMDGRLLASKKFPVKGKASSEIYASLNKERLILQALVPGGQPKLIVLGLSTIVVYDLRFENDFSTTLSLLENEQKSELPVFPLPEVDLWKTESLLWNNASKEK